MSEPDQEAKQDSVEPAINEEAPSETHGGAENTSISDRDRVEAEVGDVDPEVTGADQLFAMINRARSFERKAQELPNADIHSKIHQPHSSDLEAPGAGPSSLSSDYEIIREIARGGMGVVYEAQQISLKRRVALKVILGAPLRSPLEISRFRAEAEAVAKLDHPGVVPIHEIGVIDDTQFFSMGLFLKGSLVDQYSDVRPPPRVAAEIVKRVAETIQFTHSRNIIHRDLKPANVLLDDLDQPKVTDFGLAKDSEKDSGLTLSGTILGTPAYMAPEQARGRQEAVGQAADIYALGGVLFFLLTGEPPFAGETPFETLEQVIGVEPRNPTALNPDADPDLSTIALKCLQKAPEKRYASAQEVANDLDRWLRYEPISARPVSGWERTAKWVKRNPVVSGLMLVTGIVMIAALVVGIVYQTQLNLALQRETTAKGKAVDAADETTRVLYESLTNEAKFLSEAQPPGFGRRALGLIQQASDLETDAKDTGQLMRLAVANLGHASSTRELEFGDYPAVMIGADVTPDGRFLAVSLKSGELWIHDLSGKLDTQKLKVPFQAEDSYVGVFKFPASREMLVAPLLCREVARYVCDENGEWNFHEHVTLSPPELMFDLRLSPSANHVVGLTPMSLDNVLSLQTKVWKEQISSWHLQYNETPKFCIRPRQESSKNNSSDESWLKTDATYSLHFGVSDTSLVVAYPWNQQGDNSVHVYSLETGKQIAKFIPECGSLSRITVSQSGRFIACAGHLGLSIHDGQTGRLVNRPVELGRCQLFGFTNDDQAVTLLAGRLGVIVYSIGSGQIESGSRQPPNNWVSKTSSYGTHLLQTNSERIRVTPLQAKERRTFRAVEGVVRLLKFSPDGQLLLTKAESGRHVIWDSHSFQQLCQFDANAAAFHPSGQVFATQRSDTIQFWSLPDSRFLGTIKAPIDNPVGFKFSADGNFLAVSNQGVGSLHVLSLQGELGLERPDQAEWIFSSDSALDGVFHWGPEGNQISWETREGIYFKDFSDSAHSLFLDAKGHRFAGFAITSPTQLAYCQTIATKLTVLGTRNNNVEIQFDDKAIAPYRVSPNGRWLITRTKLHDLKTGNSMIELPIDNQEGIWDVAWSPDSRRVAIGRVTGMVEVWDLEILSNRLKSMQLGKLELEETVCRPMETITRFKRRWESRSGKVGDREWNRRLELTGSTLRKDDDNPGDQLPEITLLVEACLDDALSNPFQQSGATLTRRKQLLDLANELTKAKKHQACRLILTTLLSVYPMSKNAKPAEVELYVKMEHLLGDLFNFSLQDERPLAVGHYKREFDLRELLRQTHRETATPSEQFWMHHNYSLALNANGQVDEATRQLEQALAILESAPEVVPDKGRWGAKYQLLSGWLQSLDRVEEAKKIRQRAIRLGLSQGGQNRPRP